MTNTPRFDFIRALASSEAMRHQPLDPWSVLIAVREIVKAEMPDYCASKGNVVGLMDWAFEKVGIGND